MRRTIPWAEPCFWGRERELVADALSSTWISGGPYVERLEAGLAAFAASPVAVAVANCTAAIHLAYLALDLEPGDEVVVPGFCFLAAANVALLAGARPVFADVDARTWCVTAEGIERVLTGRTRAVVPVHTYGNACAMGPIVELCRSRGIPVVEDAAESFGSTCDGRQTGAIGDLGVLSFQATKTITTGEGGLVFARDPSLADKLRLYRSHGMLRTRYWHEVAGHNFRLTNMQAALGCAQMECLEDIFAARRTMDRTYRRHLCEIGGLSLQETTPGVDPVPWAIAVRLHGDAFPQGRDQVMAAMHDAGIETRPGFYPASRMDHLYGAVGGTPVADALGPSIVSLPSSPTLSEEEIGHICSTLARLRKKA